VFELPAVRGWRCRIEPGLAERDAGRDRGGGSGGGANEVAAIQIQLLIGDFRTANIRRVFDEHRSDLSTPERRRRLRDTHIIRESPDAPSPSRLRTYAAAGLTTAMR